MLTRLDSPLEVHINQEWINMIANPTKEGSLSQHRVTHAGDDCGEEE